ncbi:hypothetical protein QQM39_02760 [Streptomyces sp. DT2A-34]|nr:hypothetical protein [Streptomyces sp. DT2A-34]MDO0909820.1 hypothetical protein [Streptomyces sp. DT2A-34]
MAGVRNGSRTDPDTTQARPTPASGGLPLLDEETRELFLHGNARRVFAL